MIDNSCTVYLPKIAVKNLFSQELLKIYKIRISRLPPELNDASLNVIAMVLNVSKCLHY